MDNKKVFRIEIDGIELVIENTIKLEEALKSLTDTNIVVKDSTDEVNQIIN